MKRRGTPRAGKKGKGRRQEPRVHQAPAPTPASPFLRDLARVGAAASEAIERARGSIAKLGAVMRKGAAGIDPAAFRLRPGHSLISTPEAEAVASQMEALEVALRPLEVLRSAGFEVMTREEVLSEARQSATATGEIGIEAVRRIVERERARIGLQAAGLNATPEMIRRLAAGEIFFDTPEGRAEAARRRGTAETDDEYKERVSRYFAPAAEAIRVDQYSDLIALTAKDLGCEVVIDVTYEPRKVLDERSPARQNVPTLNEGVAVDHRPSPRRSPLGMLFAMAALTLAVPPAEPPQRCTCGLYTTDRACPVHGDRR